MKAVKAIYENGRIELAEEPADQGPVEVLVVFPEAEQDPWDAILKEETLRPSFQAFVDACKEEIAQGKAKPLNPDDL